MNYYHLNIRIKELLWPLAIALLIDCILFSSHFTATKNAAVRNNEAICGRQLRFIMSRSPDDKRARILEIIKEETSHAQSNQLFNCKILARVKANREIYWKSMKSHNGDTL